MQLDGKSQTIFPPQSVTRFHSEGAFVGGSEERTQLVITNAHTPCSVLLLDSWWVSFKGRLSVQDVQTSELPQAPGMRSDVITTVLWPELPPCHASLLNQNMFSKQSGLSVRPGAVVGSNRLSVSLGCAPKTWTS